jgi:hypothetical protein
MNRSGNWKEESRRLCLRNRIEFQRDENNNHISTILHGVIEEEPFQPKHLKQSKCSKLTFKRNLFKDVEDLSIVVDKNLDSIQAENDDDDNQMDCQTTTNETKESTKKRTFNNAFEEDLDYDSKRIKHVSSNENFLEEKFYLTNDNISIIELSQASFYFSDDDDEDDREMDRDESPKKEKNPRASSSFSIPSSVY